MQVRHSDTLIFLPTYNERGNIEPTVDALLALPAQCDVLVVDDKSSDGTVEILRTLSLNNPRLMAIVRPGKLGIGSAHKLGWLYARRLGYGRIVTLDADRSHDPTDVERLLAVLDQGCDVAFGSRFMPGGKHDYRGWRLVLSSGANRLARTMLRLPITDYTNSLRAARLDRVPMGLVEMTPVDGYGFFLASAARMVRAGLLLGEVPIHFRNRDQGTSKIPRFEVVRGVLNLVRVALAAQRAQPAAFDDADRECPACHGPYLVAESAGAERCLACDGRPSRDRV
jgi:dolichol-phosphate mannosyltransferase